MDEVDSGGVKKPEEEEERELVFEGGTIGVYGW
jgi:hypothetical protein